MPVENPKTTKTTKEQSVDKSGPLLFPEQRLPYRTQHVVLLAAQGLLEEACFGFAQRYLPAVLQNTRFDCPAAVELTKWAKILTNHCKQLSATVPLSHNAASLEPLTQSMRKLRHTAVHRIPVPITVVCQLVGSAADLAEVLQDDTRAGLLRDICRDVETSLEKTQAARQVLRTNADREMEQIRRAREELDRREQVMVAKALSDDADGRRELGKRLEQTVGHSIAEWEGRTAMSASARGGSDTSKTSEVKFVPSGPLDFLGSTIQTGSESEHDSEYESATSF